MIDLKKEKAIATLQATYGSLPTDKFRIIQSNNCVIMHISPRNKTKQSYAVAWMPNTQEFLLHPYTHPENDVWADDISKLLPHIDAIIK